MAGTQTPRAYRGGAAQLALNLERTRQRQEQWREAVLARTDGDPNERTGAMVEYYWRVGQALHWEGDRSAAADAFRSGAESALHYVEWILPRLQPRLAPGLSPVTHMGAVMAALAGEKQTAHRLFTYAADLAGGLVPGRPRDRSVPLGDPREAHPNDILDELARHPLIRAYSLLRLGVFEGIQALLLPADGQGDPAWHESVDIFAILDSARACLERSKAEGLGTFFAERGQLPVLDELARILTGRGGSPEAAHAALDRYWNRIRDIGDFLSIYPLVLDLQSAFPEVFGQVVEV